MPDDTELLALYHATARKLAITEANLIERTQQLEEAKAPAAPPPVEVVDRQPEIDALNTLIERYKAELKLVRDQHNAIEYQHRITEANLIERTQQHDELKRRLENG